MNSFDLLIAFYPQLFSPQTRMMLPRGMRELERK